MGTEQTDSDVAAARLRLIQAEFTTPRRTGGSDGPRPPARVTGSVPVDLGILDYMRTAVAEAVTYTRAVNPTADTAGPAPQGAGVYDWMRERTAHLGHEQRLVAAAMTRRHAIEHSLAMGDATVIRHQPCPACACWSLYWRAEANRATCVNRRCTTPGGGPASFTPHQLALHQVQSERRTAQRAT